MWRLAFNKQMLWSTADPRAVLFVHIAPGDAAPSWHIGLASVPQAGEEAEFSGRVICSCQFSSYGPRPSILLNTPVSTMQDLFPTFICSGGNFAVPCTADGLAYCASASGSSSRSGRSRRPRRWLLLHQSWHSRSRRRHQAALTHRCKSAPPGLVPDSHRGSRHVRSLGGKFTRVPSACGPGSFQATCGRTPLATLSRCFIVHSWAEASTIVTCGALSDQPSK